MKNKACFPRGRTQIYKYVGLQRKVVFLVTNKATAHVTGTGEGLYVIMSANC